MTHRVNRSVTRYTLWKNQRRRRVQWALAPIVFLVIALGWKYPYLGYTVPVVMILGMIGGLFRGRYVCGNLCPRGGFFDRIMPLASRVQAIPVILRNRVFRWLVFAALMGVMVWRASLDPANPEHWGRVFWLMCVVTTLIGVVLAFFFHPRTWCTFCPIGTVQAAVGGHRGQLRLNAATCRTCHLCEKVCPMNLPIVTHRTTGVVNEPDCLRCSECVLACPAQSLTWPE